MKIIRDNLWLCVDCLQAATGEMPADTAPARDAEILAGLERLGPNLVPDFDHYGEGHEEFMRAPVLGCACCKSNLAGEFHRFAIIAPELCRYTDCSERHSVATEDQQVTCDTCRTSLGLPCL